MGAAECSWTSLRLPPNRRRSATVVNTSADRRRCSCQTTFPRAAKLIFASCRLTLDEHAATSAFIALFLTFFGNFSDTCRRITGSSRKNSLRPFPNCTAFSAGLLDCRCPGRERRARMRRSRHESGPSRLRGRRCAQSPGVLACALVDEGAINFGSQLLVLAIPCVDPDLDDVELVRCELLDRLAAFRAGRNPLRHCCASGSGIVMLRRALRNRAAPGIVWRVFEEFVNVRAQTQRGAHTVVGAQSQVPYERVASVAEMHMRVDDHRHYGLAGEIYALSAGRHANLGRPADL